MRYLAILESMILTIDAFFLTVFLGVEPRFETARMLCEKDRVDMTGSLGVLCCTLPLSVGLFQLLGENNLDLEFGVRSFCFLKWTWISINRTRNVFVYAYFKLGRQRTYVFVTWTVNSPHAEVRIRTLNELQTFSYFFTFLAVFGHQFIDFKEQGIELMCLKIVVY